MLPLYCQCLAQFWVPLVVGWALVLSTCVAAGVVATRHPPTSRPPMWVVTDVETGHRLYYGISRKWAERRAEYIRTTGHTPRITFEPVGTTNEDL